MSKASPCRPLPPETITRRRLGRGSRHRRHQHHLGVFIVAPLSLSLHLSSSYPLSPSPSQFLFHLMLIRSKTVTPIAKPSLPAPPSSTDPSPLADDLFFRILIVSLSFSPSLSSTMRSSAMGSKSVAHSEFDMSRCVEHQ
ncbi:unnamed protein product [Camellia sinensis]